MPTRSTPNRRNGSCPLDLKADCIFMASQTAGPSANLDTRVGAQIRDLLIVTHDPKVHIISDRIIQHRDGLIHAA